MRFRTVQNLPSFSWLVLVLSPVLMIGPHPFGSKRLPAGSERHPGVNDDTPDVGYKTSPLICVHDWLPGACNLLSITISVNGGPDRIPGGPMTPSKTALLWTGFGCLYLIYHILSPPSLPPVILIGPRRTVHVVLTMVQNLWIVLVVGSRPRSHGVVPAGSERDGLLVLRVTKRLPPLRHLDGFESERSANGSDRALSGRTNGPTWNGGF